MLEWIILNLPILICLIIGMGLLVVEMIIPGFGLPGAAGLVLILVGVYMTWNAAGPLAALGVLLMMLALTGIAIAIVVRSTKSGKLSRSAFVLHDASTVATAPIGAARDEAASIIGRTGKALTPLRPAGMADMEGERLNVVSEGEFIPQGAAVIVERIEGSRIVVKATS
ncbi:membrane protein [Clostridia bacterium]|nr:membrane protein [Clostridia bacterium]